jgi:hypothetical protein
MLLNSQIDEHAARADRPLNPDLLFASFNCSLLASDRCQRGDRLARAARTTDTSRVCATHCLPRVEIDQHDV